MNKKNIEKSTILIVDDSNVNVLYIKELLEINLFSTLIANSGFEAIKIAASEKPDLILLDIMMPELDGFETCKQLKADTKTRDIPVIFISALKNNLDKVKGFNCGGIDYITKPIEESEFIARIQNQLTIYKLRKKNLVKNKKLKQQIILLKNEIKKRQKIEIQLKKSRKEARKKEKTSRILLEKLAQVQKIAKIGSWEWDLKSDNIYWSDQLYEIFELSREEYTPSLKTDEQFINPDDLEILKQKVTNSIEKGVPFMNDVKIITSSGKTKYCNTQGRLLLDALNNPEKFIGTFMDITERKQYEYQLRASEEKYRLIADFTFDWEVFRDKNGTLIYSNNSFNKITGYDNSDYFAGKINLRDFVYKEDFERVYNTLEQAKKGRKVENFNFRIQHKSGKIIYCAVNSQPVFVNGEFYGMRSSLRDITDLMEYTNQLETKQNQIRAIFDSSPVILFTIDENFKILDINSNGISFAQIIEHEKKIQNIGEIFACSNLLQNYCGTTSACKVCKLRNSIKETFNSGIEKNKIEWIVESNVNNLPYNNIFLITTKFIHYSEKNNLLVLLDDITELRQKEKQIKEAELKYRKETEIKVLNAILETEEKEKKYFSQELHDGLGPLLSAAKMYLQWINRAKNEAERQDFLNKILNLIDNSINTTKEIALNLSPHILHNFGIFAAIQNFIDNIKDVQNTRIMFYTLNNNRFLLHTELIIYRIIIECITNALKYAQATSIFIGIRIFKTDLFVVIKDDGIGFDTDIKIESKKGLGLFNIQSRIQTIGGEFKISSKPDKGTTIKFSIPV